MSVCVEKGCTAEATTRKRCESHYRKRLRMGLYGRRDVDQLRVRIARLRELGWTWDGIAEAAGVSNHTARLIHLGETKQVWPESARALLTVPLVPYDSYRGIDATGTRRRVQALAWMGWTRAEIATRAGMSESFLRAAIRPPRLVSFSLSRRVAAVYDELCMIPGPSKLAASKARKRGFLPPLAWGDDDLIDLPDADLRRELERRVGLMDEDELRASYTARRKYRDPSPLVVAAATEWDRRLRARRTEVAEVEGAAA